jgi:hypothetical protein
VAKAVGFYELALDVAVEMRRTHDVVFRLKSDEQPRTFLPARLLDRMEKLELAMDDGLSRSIDFLADFDVVVGGESTVMLEALILGCAPVLLDAPLTAAQIQSRSTLYSVLVDCLGVSRISTPQETIAACRLAADPAYLPKMRLRLAENGERLFHGLDGQSGLRVAGVILEIVAGAQVEI